MDYSYWKTLKLDTKSKFIDGLSKFDLMMNDLISSAHDVGNMRKPTEKLSTNLDFKKRAISYLDRFVQYCVRIGIKPEFVSGEVAWAAMDIDRIIEGQPRSHVRSFINDARCSFIYQFQLGDDVMIEFTHTHPDVHGIHHMPISPK